ncbi:hypothetical protein P9272_03840 [Mesorhizobium sp. WSM4976]|jgi:hypothetical protein|uniref:hypothetical protein n=1 Tax=Mesorhizobium sp. WSM4976 TaxID=3038549 RepID=UPI00241607A6|nr:hypothetical protein [Mesorhizobium sp. WSM4976]MDG4892717.1 hypothetical protein [Mesorhizobium sp. WSM4976]
MRRKDDISDEVSIYDLDGLRAAYRQSIRDNDGEATGWSDEAERFLKSAVDSPRPDRPSRRREDYRKRKSDGWKGYASRFWRFINPLQDRDSSERGR